MRSGNVQFTKHQIFPYQNKFWFQFQIGSHIACGAGVNLSKFYYYEPVSDTCLAEIGCPVPIDDTSRGNRFFSKISCLRLCRRKPITKDEQIHICILPKDTGGNTSVSFTDTHVKYYYDTHKYRCRPFHFSGNGGNDNNFDTFNECNVQCRGFR